MHTSHAPKAQSFALFAVWRPIFESRPHFEKSASNDPKWPWYIRNQMYLCALHSTYASGAQFLSILLYGEPFLPRKSEINTCTPNNPNMTSTLFKIKSTHMSSTHITEAQIFECFALWSTFSSYSPIWRKVHQMTIKWPWEIQGQKYPCAYLICPAAQIFVRFTLWWAALESMTILHWLN